MLSRKLIVPVIALALAVPAVFYAFDYPKRSARAYARSYGCNDSNIIVDKWIGPGGWGKAYVVLCHSKANIEDFKKLSSDIFPASEILEGESQAFVTINSGDLGLSDATPGSPEPLSIGYVSIRRQIPKTDWSVENISHLDLRNSSKRVNELQSHTANFLIGMKVYVVWYELPYILFS